MTQDEIVGFAGGLPGVVAVVAGPGTEAPEAAWGDTFFFYDPAGDDPRARRLPFATIVTHDYGGFDTSSRLDRDGVFRLNLWVSRETFASLVGEATSAHDPAALDRVMPHPIYAAQSWLCVLNPGPATAAQVEVLLTEAHARAVERHERRR